MLDKVTEEANQNDNGDHNSTKDFKELLICQFQTSISLILSTNQKKREKVSGGQDSIVKTTKRGLTISISLKFWVKIDILRKLSSTLMPPKTNISRFINIYLKILQEKATAKALTLHQHMHFKVHSGCHETHIEIRLINLILPTVILSFCFFFFFKYEQLKNMSFDFKNIH